MEFTSEIKVEYVDGFGSDQLICQAARVSTGSTNNNPEIDEKLINSLLKNRHGTPFEHNSFTFKVDAPIFVWREHHRHRVGFSYNEESARYKQLSPKFWIPNRDRKMIPVAKILLCPVCDTSMSPALGGIQICSNCTYRHKYHTSMNPCFQKPDEIQYVNFVTNLKLIYDRQYSDYEMFLEMGFAKEVSRTIVPVGIYSSCFVTCNCRSLMHFLSLRTHDENASFVSNPQSEIEEVAKKYERVFENRFPMTYKAFVENGRVAP